MKLLSLEGIKHRLDHQLSACYREHILDVLKSLFQKDYLKTVTVIVILKLITLYNGETLLSYGNRFRQWKKKH